MLYTGDVHYSHRLYSNAKYIKQWARLVYSLNGIVIELLHIPIEYSYMLETSISSKHIVVFFLTH